MSIAKTKLLIIDGHALAYRSFYALSDSSLTNKDGMPTGAIYGFYRLIFKTIQILTPTHLLFTFDHPAKSFRHNIYDQYKIHRKPTPPELSWQIDEIISIANTIGFQVIIKPDVEADDVIASIVTRYCTDFADTFILSGDKDLYSILYPNVTMVKLLKGVSLIDYITAKSIKEKLNLDIQDIPHYMALVGDIADNILGVKGVGEKTATKLISKYKTLENLYEHIDEISPKGVQTKLISDKKQAFLSFKLVLLKTDLPLSLNFEELIIYQHFHHAIFLEKGFVSLIKEFEKTFPHVEHLKTTSSSLEILQNFTIIKTEEDITKCRKTLEDVLLIAFDTETDSLRPFEANLIGVSWSFMKNGKIYTSYLPCILNSPYSIHSDYQEVCDFQLVFNFIKSVLENKNIVKIGQNIKYDMSILQHNGIYVENIQHDTMLLSYLLNPGSRKHNLDALANDWLGYQTVKYKDLVGSGQKQKQLVEIPLNDLAFYAAEDVEVTYRCFEKLQKEIKKENLYKVYTDIDIPLMFILQNIEAVGILLDIPTLQDLQVTYKKKLEKLKQKIYHLADEEFNINSTKELQRILFEKFNLASTIKTTMGSLSTNAKVLERLKKQHEIIPFILEHRTYAKLLSTYIETLPSYLSSNTGRIHSSFSQVIAATGRLASSDPNLQNIPIRTPEGNAIRRAFVADNDYEFLSLDYSQIELRVLAHYSDDTYLLDAFLNDLDIHDHATYLLFHNSFDATTNMWYPRPIHQNVVDLEIDNDMLAQMKEHPLFSEKRALAKVLNFSIMYGVTDWGLSQNLNISRAEAKQYIDLYFQKFYKVEEYMQKAIEEVRKIGWSINLFGRKRRILGINSKNRFERLSAERLAINSPIQSTAADILKQAMIKVFDKFTNENLKSRMTLQIHDELLFEIHISEKEMLLQSLTHIMENSIKLKVPLKVKGHF